MRIILAKLAIAVALLGVGCSGCDDLGEPDLDGCGDGVVRGGEVCDGEDFGGLSCADYGFADGELTCARSCAGVLVAGCTGLAATDELTCGPGEQLDGDRCVPPCSGDAYTSDGSLEFDVATVPLTMRLTRDGGELAPSPEGERGRPIRGKLLLRGRVWWDPIEVEVPATGPAVVELPVYPDTYEVEWRPSAEDVVGPLSLGTIDVDEATDEAFDLAPLQEVDVSVTVNGEAFADSQYDAEHATRGLLVLEREGTRSFAAVGLSDEGAATASFRVDPGPYDVWWVRKDDKPTVEFLKTMDISPGQRELAVDIPLVRIEPRITLNGHVPKLPSTTFDANLVFQKSNPDPPRLWSGWRRADTFSVPLDPRQARGSAWLVGGRYDVRLQADAAQLRGTVHLKKQLQIDGPEAADHFDIPLTAVTGVVTRNDGRLPRSGQSGTPRGRIVFHRADGSFVAGEIPGTGPAEYQLGLPAGSWRVAITGDPWSGTLPLIPVTVDREFGVSGEGAVETDFDVPAVRFLGQLTLDGERMPDETNAESRGSLEIRAEDGGIGYNLPVPRTGPALYDVLLGPGEYDVQVARWWFAVGDSPPANGILPFGLWPVGTIDVTTTTQRDIDLRTFDVSVKLTDHGDRLAATDSELRGELWIEGTDTRRLARRLEVPADGASEVATTLYPGRYRVVFQPDPSMKTLPLQPVALGTLQVGDDVTRTYDVGGISLTGTVTVNGEPLADGPDGFGTISFLRFPTVADTTVDAELDPQFDVRVAPGPYNVILHPPPDHPQLPNGAVVLSRGCTDPRLRTD